MENKPQPTAYHIPTMEKAYITKAMQKSDCKMGVAADLLGITPRTLYTKIREYQIEVNGKKLYLLTRKFKE